MAKCAGRGRSGRSGSAQRRREPLAPLSRLLRVHVAGEGDAMRRSIGRSSVGAIACAVAGLTCGTASSAPRTMAATVAPRTVLTVKVSYPEGIALDGKRVAILEDD